jgi:hypothetical protein
MNRRWLILIVGLFAMIAGCAYPATPPPLGALVTGAAYGTAFAAVVVFPLAAALLIPAQLGTGHPDEPRG